MTPLQSYQQKIQEHMIQWDPAQTAAIQQLQQIHNTLLNAKKPGLLRKQTYCKGLYLWGKVGRGKTQLMDLFYECLPIAKLRLHFYAFMQNIHIALTQLQGRANPLEQIAKDLAATAKVICLDEFLVHEIGNALLLAHLLQGLFQHGVTLVTTANTAPDDLYQNGLQRELFLPAITQIKQHLTIFHLDSPTDYRIPQGLKNNRLSLLTPVLMQHTFANLTKGKTIFYHPHHPLMIHGRQIPHKGYTQDTICFDFTTICNIPRSQLDYLLIAKRFTTVLISQVKPIAEHDDHCARLFIHLVDIFYDAHIKLLLSSDHSFIDLYPKGRFLAEFERTKSRLLALQYEFKE
jgi:cell division protein ZapE